jgi:hypothetical protein
VEEGLEVTTKLRPAGDGSREWRWPHMLWVASPPVPSMLWGPPSLTQPVKGRRKERNSILTIEIGR